MPLRRFIGYFILCMIFVLSSTYVQAMRLVDGRQASAHVEVGPAQFPPCHNPVKDRPSDGSSKSHHGSCLSNFACCLGLVAETLMHDFVRGAPPHRLSTEEMMRSALPEPLNPPPEAI